MAQKLSVSSWLCCFVVKFLGTKIFTHKTQINADYSVTSSDYSVVKRLLAKRQSFAMAQMLCVSFWLCCFVALDDCITEFHKEGAEFHKGFDLFITGTGASIRIYQH